MSKEKQKSNYLTSGGERASYGLYFVGQNIFYIFVYFFLSVYLLDSGIPALTVTAILLVVKIWDAINDPIFGGLVTTMTDVQSERTSLQAIGRVCAQIASLFIAVGVPSVREAIGGWLPTILVLAVAALITMIPICITAKERITTKAAKSAEGDKGVSMKEMFSYLGHNKFLLIFYLSLFISYAANVQSTLGMIFARNCLGDESMQSILSLVGLIPAVIMGTLIPKLCKKFDKFMLFFGSIVACTALGFIQFLLGYVAGENAIQPAGFADKLWLVYALIPTIGLLITIPILWQYKLRDKDVEVMAKCNAGEITGC